MAGRQIVEVDRAGRETVIAPQLANYFSPRWSPNGDRIAVVKRDGGLSHIWIYDTRSQTLSQLTTEGDNVRPSWSPDGTRVAFYSSRGSTNDLYWMPADGSGPAEKVADGDDTLGAGATFWTRDGAWIIVDGNTQVGMAEDVFAIGTGTDRKMQAVVATVADEQAGVVSPDGKWIAYVSTESGRPQVYLRPFMQAGGRWLVSTGSAVNALWASNTELTYRETEGRTMVAATLALGEDVRVVERRPLFSDASYMFSSGSIAEHDLSWNGQRFLMLKRPQQLGEREDAVVVLNWAEEVRQRMVEQGGRAP